MKNNKFIGYILIFLPFVFIEYISYKGSYLETGSWEATFSEVISSFPYFIGYHLPLIIGIIIIVVTYKKNNKQEKKKKKLY